MSTDLQAHGSRPAASSRKSKVASAKEEQQLILDNLLSQYLQALHNYTTLQEQLRSDLAAGFISLAEANFKRSSSSQDRYGQDDYDERMKAMTVVNITKVGEKLVFSTAVPEAALGKEEVKADVKVDDDEKPLSESKPIDPIRQFGILVPPALRAAQQSFKRAVHGPMIGLLEAQAELEALDRRIKMARET